MGRNKLVSRITMGSKVVATPPCHGPYPEGMGLNRGQIEHSAGSATPGSRNHSWVTSHISQWCSEGAWVKEADSWPHSQDLDTTHFTPVCALILGLQCPSKAKHTHSLNGAVGSRISSGRHSLIVLSQVSPDLRLPGFAKKGSAKFLWRAKESPVSLCGLQSLSWLPSSAAVA